MKRISHHSASSETARASLSCARVLAQLQARVQAQQSALELMLADGARAEAITQAGTCLHELLVKVREVQGIAQEVEQILKEQKRRDI